MRSFGILEPQEWATKPSVNCAHDVLSVIPSFKTCLPLHVNMRITDPRWPAVREAARILLREEHLAVHGPAWLETKLHDLAVSMGDKLPARLSFPLFLNTQDHSITIVDRATMETRVECSRVEPARHVVWVPLECDEAWMNLEATAMDLLEAGYPGCVGCAGPEAEAPWDETTSRKRIKTDEIDG